MLAEICPAVLYAYDVRETADPASVKCPFEGAAEKPLHAPKPPLQLVPS